MKSCPEEKINRAISWIRLLRVGRYSSENVLLWKVSQQAMQLERHQLNNRSVHWCCATCQMLL